MLMSISSGVESSSATGTFIQLFMLSTLVVPLYLLAGCPVVIESIHVGVSYSVLPA